MKTASWIVIDKLTGRAVLETYSPKTAEHIRTIQGYKVIPILEYLQSLNKGDK